MPSGALFIMKRFTFFFVLILIASDITRSQEKADSSKTKPDSLRYTDEIVVTATRAPSELIEVPLAISVVGIKTLQQTRGFGLNEALANVPGVLAQTRSGNQDVRLTIRGFGARGAGERSNAGTSRGIRIMTDGIPETEPDGRTSFDLIDFSTTGRIEVIRSNASAVWGNASGGVVNLISNTAFTQPYLDLQSGVGSFGFRKESVSGGVPFESGKVVFALSNTNLDGWRDHSRSSQALFSAGVFSALSTRTRLGITLKATTHSYRIPGPLTQAEFDANPQQANPTFAQRDERRLNRLGRIGVTLAHEFDDRHTVSAMTFVNPKYLQRSERNTFRDFTRYHLGGNFIYSYSARLSEVLRSKLVAGVDEAYQDGAILFYSLTADGNRGSTLRDNKREGANTFGAFVQEEVMFGDRVSVIVGGRLDAVTYFNESFIDSRIKGEKVFQRLTPRGGVSYRFSPSHSLYANLGGGIEVPAGNETDVFAAGADSLRAFNSLLEPIVSTTLEVGTKQILSLQNSVLRGLSYDAALYWIAVANDVVPYQSGRFYETVGRTRRIGFELGASAEFQHGVSLSGALTLSRNEYESYVIDSTFYGKPGASRDLSNNQVAGVPNVFYSASVRYEPTWAPEWVAGFFTELSAQGVGRYFTDDVNSLTVAPYTVLNATIGFNGSLPFSERLRLRGFVTLNNLTDAKYAASAFVNPDRNAQGEAIFLEAGLPRNTSASLSLGWQF